MGKFLRNLTDGSLRCKYCGDKECNCMEDGWTEVDIIAVWRYGDKGTSTLIQLAKQTLPNGKKIPSGYRLWIAQKDQLNLDPLLKKMTLKNDFLNKLRFD